MPSGPPASQPPPFGKGLYANSLDVTALSIQEATSKDNTPSSGLLHPPPGSTLARNPKSTKTALQGISPHLFRRTRHAPRRLPDADTAVNAQKTTCIISATEGALRDFETQLDLAQTRSGAENALILEYRAYAAAADRRMARLRRELEALQAAADPVA